MNYTDLRSQLKTGDIILFSGRGPVSRGIQWTTNSPWSHVGLVVYDETLDLLTLWESTTLSNIKDIYDGQLHKGVQTVPLSDRIRTYDGEVAARLLTHRLTADQQRSLGDLRKEVAYLPYEESEMALIKAAYDGPFGENTQDLSSYFCSELVGKAYIEMGLFSMHWNPSEMIPANFSNLDPAQDYTQDLQPGQSLGEEITLEL